MYDDQRRRLLKYLKTHKRGITTFDAVEKLRIYRISARIFELREAGHEIKTLMHDVVNPDTGERTRYGQYVLTKEAKA